MTDAANPAGPADAAAPAADPANPNPAPAAAAGNPAAAAPAAAAAPDLSKPDTALTGGDDPAKAAAPATWPEDWRDKLAKGDEKRINVFSRYASPEALADALIAAQTKIRSGELKSGKPGEGAKPEEIAEWRKQNGIPETPDKYDLTLNDGLVIGEDDKPLVDKVLASMHAADLPQAAVKSVLNAYYEMREEQQAQRVEEDRSAKQATEDALRAEWGPEYRANLKTVESYLSTLPDGLGEKIVHARLGDGTPLFSDPTTLRWLLGNINELNPAHTVVPGAGANAGTAIADELANIEKLMGDQKSEYWKGPTAEKLQARYRELVSAKEKMASKAA